MLENGERRKTRSDGKTAVLVDAWSADTIQKLLLGSKRTAKAYNKIVKVLLPTLPHPIVLQPCLEMHGSCFSPIPALSGVHCQAKVFTLPAL